MAYSRCDRTTRSGRVWASYIEPPDEDVIFLIQLPQDVDSTELLKDAYGREDEEEGEEAQSFQGAEEKPNVAESAGNKRRREEEGDSGQSLAHKRRRIKRQKLVEGQGHPSGHGRAFEKTVLPAVPLLRDFDSAMLPFAKGAWIGKAPKQIPRAKERITLEDLDKEKFHYVAWNGRTPVPILDKDGRVLVTLYGRPSDPTYLEATGRVSDKVLQKREDVLWKAGEVSHERGEGFPAPAYGISYGKGQPEPMRLKGERYKLMEELVSDADVQRIAAFQSAGYALWYPRNYAEFQNRRKQLRDKLPHLKPNFPNSVYSCITINFGPQTCTHIHLDSKNVPDACCAITAGGKFDSKEGGHLILSDLKMVIEFPAGSTILLPSALLKHSNVPVRDGETRISITQYTAGGIHRWLEYGGRTEDALRKADLGEFRRQMSLRNDRWKVALARFCTLDELKAGIVV
ncbi:hypothetical protein PQX77_004417 [Marasmius sp. AFHP31]|nr:hypothetical protein PQX77_004417 [Marasmius sp. AFHP31]